jgi:hypothetical protein
MPAPPRILDVTNTVSIADAASVQVAVDEILAESFGAGRVDRGALAAGFELVDRLFAGRQPGYLACDMAFHDLRHSLDTALVTARLVAGCRRAGSGAAGAVRSDMAVLGVLLALLHDVGYLRKAEEAALVGPQLMANHETRSAEFAAGWLSGTALAEFAPLATLIHATRLGADCDRLFAEGDPQAVALGRMLGTADLLSQIADRLYVERCYYHLYPELVLAGLDRRQLPDGREELLYRDAFDLVGKTRAFCEHVIAERLRRAFGEVAHGLPMYFGGTDPYAEAVAGNLDRLERMSVGGIAGLLADEPATTTCDLAAVYHAPRPRADP